MDVTKSRLLAVLGAVMLSLGFVVVQGTPSEALNSCRSLGHTGGGGWIYDREGCDRADAWLRVRDARGSYKYWPFTTTTIRRGQTVYVRPPYYNYSNLTMAICTWSSYKCIFGPYDWYSGYKLWP